MNNFVVMMEIILFFLNKFLGINVGSCKYTIGDKELSYLNMIDDGKVTCTMVSGLGPKDIMLMYEYDDVGACSKVKVEDETTIHVDNTYVRDNSGFKVVSQAFNARNMEIEYGVIDKNKFYTTLSYEYGDKEYTTTTSTDNVVIRIVDNSSGQVIEVITDDGIPELFIVDRREVFDVTDDPMRYIGSYQPKYVKITDGEVICEVGLLCNKKGNDNDE